MGDPELLLPLPLPPTNAITPGLATPSGLTPNTRSEAEAAFYLNASTQTDAAAPTTPLATMSSTSTSGPSPYDDGDGGALSEAQKAYRRPAGPVRTSSTNYTAALSKAHEEESASSDLSVNKRTGSLTGVRVGVPFPEPGKGVVPLHPVGLGQVEALKRAKPAGLSLGALERRQSWNEQDLRHLNTAGLMGDVKGDAGYGSGVEGKGVGGVK